MFFSLDVYGKVIAANTLRNRFALSLIFIFSVSMETNWLKIWMIALNMNIESRQLKVDLGPRIQMLKTAHTFCFKRTINSNIKERA